MSSKYGTPTAMNLPRLISEYGNEETCRRYLEGIRWPDGTKCPRDGKNATWLGTQQVWECNSCGYQFTVRVGSVLQDSKLPLCKWLIATFLIIESRKGMSANQLRRTLGTTYKTAWYLSHRIREAMGRATGNAPLRGTVEVDETYVGGKPRFNSHKKGPNPRKPKTVVLGAVARGGEIRLRIERDGTNRDTLTRFVRQNLADDVERIYTDSSPSYAEMTDANTTHERVNHREYEWVRGDVHTNSVESVWSLFKRSIVGSYHHMSVKHMDSYLNEMEWRYNNRHNDYLFRDTLRALFKSQTLTYRRLVGRPA